MYPLAERAALLVECHSYKQFSGRKRLCFRKLDFARRNGTKEAIFEVFSYDFLEKISPSLFSQESVSAEHVTRKFIFFAWMVDHETSVTMMVVSTSFVDSVDGLAGWITKKHIRAR